MGGVFLTVLFVQAVTAQAVNKYYYGDDAYEQVQISVYPRGRIVEFTNNPSGFCNSGMLIPGISILPKGFLFILYLLFLLYLFLGISIISDVFMSAIEVITSTRRTIYVKDDDGNMRKRNVAVWNPTIANLTLMALGSSAPEILLNCIETIKTLGSTPSELGIAAIIGSAAFNFLVITGVSIASVSEEDDTRTDEEIKEDDTPKGVKKVKDTGVFTVTSIFSLLAYGWLFFCLSDKDSIVTRTEAWVTMVLFFILVILAFIMDRVNAARTK